MKCKYRVIGTHVRCLIFSLQPFSFTNYALCGELIFDVREWPARISELSQIMTIEELPKESYP